MSYLPMHFYSYVEYFWIYVLIEYWHLYILECCVVAKYLSLWLFHEHWLFSFCQNYCNDSDPWMHAILMLKVGSLLTLCFDKLGMIIYMWTYIQAGRGLWSLGGKNNYLRLPSIDLDLYWVQETECHEKCLVWNTFCRLKINAHSCCSAKRHSTLSLYMFHSLYYQFGLYTL